MKNKLINILLFLLPMLIWAQRSLYTNTKKNDPVVVQIHRLTDIQQLSNSQKQILKEKLQNTDRFDMYYKANVISRIPEDVAPNFMNIGGKIIYNVKTAVEHEAYETYQRINFPLLEYRLPCIIEVKGYTGRKFEEEVKKNVVAKGIQYIESPTPTIYLKMWLDEIGNPHFYGELVIFP